MTRGSPAIRSINTNANRPANAPPSDDTQQTS